MRADRFFASEAALRARSAFSPPVAAFFADYLAAEKVVPFQGRHVVNTHFPPYPSRAFDCFLDQLGRPPAQDNPRLYSVTVAATNRCRFRCWHCYNAGRSERDLPLDVFRRLAPELQDRGAVAITVSGGEPLLRDDLEQIVAAFDDRSAITLNTTGDGLTPARARALRGAGLFALGVSLDSSDEAEHDRLRGVPGAFRIALRGLGLAAEAGLYPYVIAVATREFLAGDLDAFLRFAAGAGAREVHLLEPVPVGRLAGRNEVVLRAAERQAILDAQRRVAGDETLPILSTFAYLESPDTFGCGAGLTHLYVDGSGEVCPCNQVPYSFGNLEREPLDAILARMRSCFHSPRCSCVGRVLGPRLPAGPRPVPPEVSARLCALPRETRRPRFFEALRAGRAAAGVPELQAAYDRIHADYDAHWLSEAGRPVEALVDALALRGDERVFEAGCGTGFATALAAAQLGKGGHIAAVDLSAGMIEEARRRLGPFADRVDFICGDALARLAEGGTYDAILSTWVLGYIPLRPFFRAAARSLKPGGRLAFVIHRDGSPREPLDVYAGLIAEQPAALLRPVRFDFPRDDAHLRGELAAAGLVPERLEEGQLSFRFDTAAAAFEHLLKSGAGTVFHDAIDPARRDALDREFLVRLAPRIRRGGRYEVVHDYFLCLAAPGAGAARSGKDEPVRRRRGEEEG
jgi:MoaA/NifB/PqqE/SkfB family radical SAM enzyme/SAM-dependent methyltransferase